MALALTSLGAALVVAPQPASAAEVTRLSGAFVTKTALGATYGSSWRYDSAVGRVMGRQYEDRDLSAWDLNTGSAWDVLAAETPDTIEVPAPGHPGPIKFLTGDAKGLCLGKGPVYETATAYSYAIAVPCDTALQYQYIDQGADGFWLVTTTGNQSMTDAPGGSSYGAMVLGNSAGYNELYNAKFIGFKKVTATVTSQDDDAKTGVIGGVCQPGGDLTVRDGAGRAVGSSFQCAEDGTWTLNVTGLAVGNNPFAVTQVVNGTETNTAETSITIGTASLALAKTSSKAGQSVLAGTQFSYFFDVTNSGSIAATNSVVRDKLPAGVAPASAAFPQGDWASYDTASRTVTSKPIASLAAKTGAQRLTLDVTVVAGATDATLVNAGLVERSSSSTDPASCYTSPLPAVCAKDPNPPHITAATAVNDSAKTHTGEPVTIPVLANDTGDAATLRVDSVTNPGSGGTAAITTDGKQITYTSAAGFTGTETFTYKAADAGGTSKSATVTVTVIPRPVANDDAYTIATSSPAATYPVLANDTGDGIGLDASYALSAAHGTVSATGNQLTYRPNAGYTGTDTVTYQIVDSLGASARATVTFTIQAGPAAPNLSKTIPMGGTATFAVSVPSGGSVTTQPASGGTTTSGGTVTAAADGTLTYKGKSGFSGQDTFTYTVRDALEQAATGTVTITVQPAPLARADAKTIAAGGTAAFTVLDASSAPAGTDKIASVTTSPASGGKTAHGGTVTVNADKTISYVAPAGYAGTDTVSFTLTDNLGQTSTASLTITVVDGPVAPAKSAVIKRDSQASFTVVAPGASIASVTTSPASGGKTASGGTVSVNPDQTITYVPASGFVGTDTLTYTLTDSLGQKATGTITVTVQAPPVARPLAVTIREGGTATFTVLDASSAPAGIAKIASVTTTPAAGGTTSHGGKVTLAADHSISYAASATYVGTDSVGYTLTDDLGQSSSSTLTITVQPAPKAKAQSKEIPEGGTATFTVLDSTSAPAGSDITSVTTSPASGSATANGGTVTIGSDKTVRYQAKTGFTGTDTITFTLTDNLGQSSQALLTIDVVAGPTAQDQAVTIRQGGAATFTVIAQGAPASTTVTTSPTSGSKTAKGGTVVVGPNRTVSYAAAATFVGVDTVTFTLTDALGQQVSGTLTITVQAPPQAQDQAARIPVAGRSTFTVVDATSAPAGTSKIVSVTTTPTTGGHTSAGGTVTVNADNTITYVAPAGYAGKDSVSYTLTDNLGQTSTATITITIQPAPLAQAAAKTIAMGGTASFSVIDAASAPAGTDKITSLSTNPASGGSTSHGGSVTVGADRTVTYRAAAGYAGSDTIDFTLKDDLGQTSSATLTIFVQPTPVAPDKAALIAVGGTASFTVLDASSAPAGTDKIASVTTAPASGGKTAHGGTVTVGKDNSISYQGAPGYSGTDTFSYTLTDDLGQHATGTITVTIQPGVVAPDRNSTIPKGGKATFTVVDAASAPAGGNKVTVSTQPGSGASTAAGGRVDVAADKTVTYTPTANFTGTDTFSYTLTDDLGQDATGTITVTVQPPPEAQSAQITIPVAGHATFTVVTATSAPAGAAKIVTVATTPASGSSTANNGTVTINPDRTVTYQAADSFSGRDSFTVTLTDDLGQSSTATLYIEVQPAPQAADFAKTIKVGGSAQFTVVTAASAPAGTDKIDSVTTWPPAELKTDKGGTITVGPDDQVSYQAMAGFTGVDTFTYTLHDDQGQASTGTVTITVQPRPIAPSLTKTIPVAGTATFDVITSSSAPAGAETIRTVETKPASGSTTAGGATITVTSAKQVRYQAPADFHGVEEVSYTLTDDLGQQASGTITVTVQPTPAPEDHKATIAQGAAATFVVLDEKSAPAGKDHISATRLDPEGGTTDLGGKITVNADGSITYTAAPGAHGEDSFRYALTDDLGQETWATIRVTIQQAPAAKDATAVIAMGRSVDFAVVTDASMPAGADKLAALSLSGTDDLKGTVTVANDVISYQSAAEWSGSETFSYTLTDDLGQTSSARVTVLVQAAPQIEGQHLKIALNTDAVFDLDGSYTGTKPTLSVLAQPEHGTATLAGDTLTYHPEQDFAGTDQIEVSVSDDLGQEDTAVFTVTVQAPPVLTGRDDLVTGLSQPLTTSYRADAVIPFPEGTTFIVGEERGGSAKDNGQGAVTFTPDAERPGATGSYQVTAIDDLGQRSTARFAITLVAGPAANDATVVTTYGHAVDVDVVGAIANGNALALSTETDPGHGTAVIADGAIRYTPAAGFSGTDLIGYLVTDSVGQVASATITVLTFAPPKAPDLNGRTPYETPIDFEPLEAAAAAPDAAGGATAPGTPSGSATATATPSAANASYRAARAAIVAAAASTPPRAEDSVPGALTDSDGRLYAPATVTEATSPSHGAAEVGATGRITYTPEGGYAGSDEFKYTVRDSLGQDSTGTITVMVDEAKPVPTPSPSATPTPTVSVTATPSPAPTLTVTATPSPAPTVTSTTTLPPVPAPTPSCASAPACSAAPLPTAGGTSVTAPVSAPAASLPFTGGAIGGAGAAAVLAAGLGWLLIGVARRRRTAHEADGAGQDA